MMNLSSTNEEIEALKYFLGEGNKAMNQLLVSNCETDIALLNDEVENELISISYDRESVISNLMKIKALYTLILKQFYKTNHRSREFFRGTNLAEIERLKNEPFVDKIVSATRKANVAENKFAANWNKPTCINIKLDSNVPYLIVKNVLENDSDDVIIAPFTKIKNFDLSSEKQLNNTSKTIKIYNIELEKQELEDLTDKERYGLYNYILENSYLVKVKLDECIKLEKENAINFENIRKLEQLLVKYENSADEKENDKEYSDIERQTDYDDVQRITKELDELKKVTTETFELRRENVNFINMWKRNIAVYMIAECNEIEKKFLGIDTKKEEDDEQLEKLQIEQTEELEEIVENELPKENTKISEMLEEKDEEIDNKVEEIEEQTEEDETSDTQIEEQEDLESQNEDKAQENNIKEESAVLIRVKNESKENMEAVETLTKNIQNLIQKQQNHARIAGNIGSIYSALNNAFEMKNVAENISELLNKIDLKIQEVALEENEEKLENISKVNIEISTLLNYLNNPRIALKNTRITRFEEMAIIEENELKRGIAEKIREIRGEAELKKLKDDLEIIEDKTAFSRFIGFFTGQNKLDDFMIDQIEIRQKTIRKNLSKKLSLAYNYSVHELMAEIEMFIEDNEDDELVEDDVLDLKELAEELRRNYIISESKVHNIAQMKSGKQLPVNSKKVSRYELIEIETYRFLNKYGYDMELRNNEPKYQDTMASEMLRIVEYINSSKIF